MEPKEALLLNDWTDFIEFMDFMLLSSGLLVEPVESTSFWSYLLSSLTLINLFLLYSSIFYPAVAFFPFFSILLMHFLIS
jgi:hypothetical protein